jgi:hypothetical protein
MLALRVTLRLWEDKPSTHQSFWWMLVLYEWRSMDKTQYMNDVQHKEKLRLKITLELKIQTLKYVQTTQSQQHNDQTYITMQLQQLDWILHA